MTASCQVRWRLRIWTSSFMEDGGGILAVCMMGRGSVTMVNDWRLKGNPTCAQIDRWLDSLKIGIWFCVFSILSLFSKEYVQEAEQLRSMEPFGLLSLKAVSFTNMRDQGRLHIYHIFLRRLSLFPCDGKPRFILYRFYVIEESSL